MLTINALSTRLAASEEEEKRQLAALLHSLPAEPHSRNLDEIVAGVLQETEKTDERLLTFLYLSLLKELNEETKNQVKKVQQLLEPEKWKLIRDRLQKSCELNKKTYIAAKAGFKSPIEIEAIPPQLPHHEQLAEGLFGEHAAKAITLAGANTVLAGQMLPGLTVPPAPLAFFLWLNSNYQYLSQVAHGFAPAVIAMRALYILITPLVKGYQYYRYRQYNEAKPTLTTEEAVDLTAAVLFLGLAIATMVVTSPIAASAVGLALAGVGLAAATADLIQYWFGHYKINKKIKAKEAELLQYERDEKLLEKMKDEINRLKVEIKHELKYGTANATKLKEKYYELSALENEYRFLSKHKPSFHISKLQHELNPLRYQREIQYRGFRQHLPKSIGFALATVVTLAAVCGLIGTLMGPLGAPLIFAGAVIGIAACVVTAAIGITMGIHALVKHRDQKKINFVGHKINERPVPTSMLQVEHVLAPGQEMQNLMNIELRSERIADIKLKLKVYAKNEDYLPLLQTFFIVAYRYHQFNHNLNLYDIGFSNPSIQSAIKMAVQTLNFVQLQLPDAVKAFLVQKDIQELFKKYDITIEQLHQAPRQQLSASSHQAEPARRSLEK